LVLGTLALQSLKLDFGFSDDFVRYKRTKYSHFYKMHSWLHEGDTKRDILVKGRVLSYTREVNKSYSGILSLLHLEIDLITEYFTSKLKQK